MLKQYKFELTTQGRGIYNLTDKIAEFVVQGPVDTGLCNVFLHHTSASLILCENDDPLVQKDLESFMTRLVPDGDPIYEHVMEGPDDMPSHVRSILTSNSLMVPISNHKLDLGRWQGIYIWEHRIRSHLRKVTVTIQG
ncbi:MAG TPA: secondary thiamine-phosphate synthase enzyme YjbQ [Gammaproteobacteria bacterium]|jgi:secondary thiamine-phosphate synthase enzyme|nr:secondary thiamine-phosphate synthase enzyme YjbQ [Gammaproteobacteria bacterium]